MERPVHCQERKIKHAAVGLRVFVIAPQQAANLGIDIGGDECRNRAVMRGQAQGEVVFDVFSWRFGPGVALADGSESVFKAEVN